MQEEHNNMKVVENKQVYIAAIRKLGGGERTGTHASVGGHGLGEGASIPKDEVATVGGLARNSKCVDVDVVAEGAAVVAAEGAADAAAGEAAEGADTAATTAAATATVASEARSISPTAPFGLTLCLIISACGLLLLTEI